KLFLQSLAQLGFVFSRWTMVRFQSDENFAVRRTDCRRIAECQIDRSRQTDIIQHHFQLIRRYNFANSFFDSGEILFSRFQTRSRWRPNVKAELPRVYVRKKVLTEHWIERK